MNTLIRFFRFSHERMSGRQRKGFDFSGTAAVEEVMAARRIMLFLISKEKKNKAFFKDNGGGQKGKDCSGYGTGYAKIGVPTGTLIPVKKSNTFPKAHAVAYS
jgi:DNA polymerase III alpha subunit (gram-positive type)